MRAVLMVTVVSVATTGVMACLAASQNSMQNSVQGSVQHWGSAPVAFTHVTVVDVDAGRLVPEQTVLVQGNRIHAVGPVGSVPVPREAQVVAATGKYLMPGLWDMHAHIETAPDIAYPMLIANGVTGIRDPGTGVPLDTLRQWRREVASGARIGPRDVVSGPMLNWAEEYCCGGMRSVVVPTPDDAPRIIDSLQRAGADFIKLHYFTLERDTYFAIAAAARRARIPFVGHLPAEVTPVEASDSGQRTFEHISYLNQTLGEEGVVPVLQDVCFGDAASVSACEPIAQRLARNGSWAVTTLVFRLPSSSRRALYDQFDVGAVAYNRAVPDASTISSASVTDLSTLDTLPDPFPGRFLDVAYRSGLPMLVGTDATLGGMVRFGFSVHDELELLVREGLPPAAALRAATLGPAQVFEATDSLGTIARGKLADLVLLDGDPFTDIRNTRRVRVVMANGRYFDRAALDDMLDQVRLRARRAWAGQP